ncbi:MmcQ/YjbR family DNA-binding protein [Gemmata sp. G18]|uniref:MmcQ/YjbR family DNA-binding protein n=1 Tax=Gemmata palustris TaxID=2822762 RepID=A0ABS5C2Q2_9BACT|nr:MmcQ/YjbR family DNA-binding protein [Gemmata palustris]MBP3960264.1 MmcQ/YjbR family DNA-binding protein [Gemmata palustris]
MPDADPLALVETALRDLAVAYPGATEDFPWGHRAIKVKAKIFLILALNEGKLSVTMKLPDSGRYALTQRYARPTGYGLGKSGWVTCTFHPTDEPPMDLLEEWVDESYRTIAPKKLVLALNARLGGAEPPLAPPASPPPPPPVAKKSAPAAKKPKAARKPAKPRKKT